MTPDAESQLDRADAGERLSPQRALFDLPDDVTYLNCAYLSPQLRSVTEAGLAAVPRKARPWERKIPNGWFAGAEALRAAAARLMGAEAEGVALVPSVSYGISTAAANLPVARGQNIVVLAEQFPSNYYAWHDVATAGDAVIRTVRRPPLEGWTESVLEAIDEDTAVVAVPNCHWSDGAFVDLVRVGQRAREVGAAFVVDASQSLGAHPLDVAEIQPDFLASVTYKWQLGPYELAYLYASPRWRETGRPLEASWQARADAADFAGLVDYTDEYAAGARRFDMGGYPQFILGAMALAALEQVLEWGVDRVRATIAPITRLIADEARALGCVALDEGERVGHMVGVRLPNGIPSDLMRRLEAERVHVSVRGDSIRISPHVYNDESDAHRLLSVLREVV
ncbi:MAG: aminotransferase class V-fold PLP-dependent enzyme [Gemmatimonadales bacterium]|jgi:selenocysteine lyase/cysteine desulfurase